MKVALVQFSPWDKAYYFDASDILLRRGDYVIVRTELGLEFGETAEVREVGSLSELGSDAQGLGELKPVVRLATKDDYEKINRPKEKFEVLKACKHLIAKHELPMKLVDARFSHEGNRITFAFIADGRVDFRDLVKDLTRQFNAVIRLQQIGIRDEARMTGDYGHCGMPLCCGRFLNDLTSITSEMAELQQCSHRGSDRISGVCGRLMCCLSYEEKGYQELHKKLPPVGTKVNVDGKRGIVVGHHVLKQSVDVEFPAENGEDRSMVVEVDLNRNKKKE